MFDQRLLDKELSAIGVRKNGKLTYDIVSPNPSLRWKLTFRLRGVYRWEIDGVLWVSHAVATPFAKQCLSQFAGDWWSDALMKQPAVETGIRCPIANLTNWGPFQSLEIKDLTAQESASRIASDVAAHVEPFVQLVRDDAAYLSLVLSDDHPMTWVYGQPLTRFAEAVKLLIDQGQSIEAAKQALYRVRVPALGQVQGMDLEKYASSVVRSASRT